MNELQPLLDLLTAKYGWAATVIGWMGMLRIPMKLAQTWLQNTMTRLIQRVRETPDLEDDEMIKHLLSARWYRWLSLLMDVILSVKLPTAASFRTTVPEDS